MATIREGTVAQKRCLNELVAVTVNQRLGKMIAF